MAEEKPTARRGADDDNNDYSFDPGSQIELEVEEICCITGEEVKSGFCRFPDYRRGTLMVMSKKEMIKHLRADTTLETFREILVGRHGKEVLEDYPSS